jgi:hypothetical protein
VDRVVNQNPPEPGLYDKHDNAAVRRLALQGHKSAAKELVRRSKGCETVSAFFKRMLTQSDREHLTARQFDVLDDAYEEQWQATHQPIVNVSAKTNVRL